MQTLYYTVSEPNEWWLMYLCIGCASRSQYRMYAYIQSVSVALMPQFCSLLFLEFSISFPPSLPLSLSLSLPLFPPSLPLSLPLSLSITQAVSAVTGKVQSSLPPQHSADGPATSELGYGKWSHAGNPLAHSQPPAQKGKHLKGVNDPAV